MKVCVETPKNGTFRSEIILTIKFFLNFSNDRFLTLLPSIGAYILCVRKIIMIKYLQNQNEQARVNVFAINKMWQVIPAVHRVHRSPGQVLIIFQQIY